MVRDELQTSRHVVSEAAARACDTFAYPHGNYCKTVRAEVARAGFTSAAAVKNALSHDTDDPLALARWTVTCATSTVDLARVLDGNGAPIAWSGERIRTRVHRLWRRSRSRLRR
jgi:hypothetical protein